MGRTYSRTLAKGQTSFILFFLQKKGLLLRDSWSLKISMKEVFWYCLGWIFQLGSVAPIAKTDILSNINSKLIFLFKDTAFLKSRKPIFYKYCICSVHNRHRMLRDMHEFEVVIPRNEQYPIEILIALSVTTLLLWYTNFGLIGWVDQVN